MSIEAIAQSYPAECAAVLARHGRGNSGFSPQYLANSILDNPAIAEDLSLAIQSRQGYSSFLGGQSSQPKEPIFSSITLGMVIVLFLLVVVLIGMKLKPNVG